eukprot:SAG11_NODE_136_length_15118_cov_14.188495_20_plen_317_part_00
MGRNHGAGLPDHICVLLRCATRRSAHATDRSPRLTKQTSSAAAADRTPAPADRMRELFRLLCGTTVGADALAAAAVSGGATVGADALAAAAVSGGACPDGGSLAAAAVSGGACPDGGCSAATAAQQEGQARSPRALVLHNGVLDLMFLYESFHRPLPGSISAFVGQLSRLFPLVRTAMRCIACDMPPCMSLLYVRLSLSCSLFCGAYSVLRCILSRYTIRSAWRSTSYANSPPTSNSSTTRRSSPPLPSLTLVDASPPRWRRRKRKAWRCAPSMQHMGTARRGRAAPCRTTCGVSSRCCGRQLVPLRRQRHRSRRE